MIQYHPPQYQHHSINLSQFDGDRNCPYICLDSGSRVFVSTGQRHPEHKHKPEGGVPCRGHPSAAGPVDLWCTSYCHQQYAVNRISAPATSRLVHVSHKQHQGHQPRLVLSTNTRYSNKGSLHKVVVASSGSGGGVVVQQGCDFSFQILLYKQVGPWWPWLMLDALTRRRTGEREWFTARMVNAGIKWKK